MSLPNASSSCGTSSNTKNPVLAVHPIFNPPLSEKKPQSAMASGISTGIKRPGHRGSSTTQDVFPDLVKEFPAEPVGKLVSVRA